MILEDIYTEFIILRIQMAYRITISYIHQKLSEFITAKRYSCDPYLHIFG